MKKITKALVIIPNNGKKEFILTFTENETSMWAKKIIHYKSIKYTVKTYYLDNEKLVYYGTY